MYVRFPLSLRNVEDLLFERGFDVSHETVRFWWNRFGPMFVSDISSVQSAQGVRPVPLMLTRYDKLAANFLSGIALATALAFWL